MEKNGPSITVRPKFRRDGGTSTSAISATSCFNRVRSRSPPPSWLMPLYVQLNTWRAVNVSMRAPPSSEPISIVTPPESRRQDSTRCPSVVSTPASARAAAAHSISREASKAYSSTRKAASIILGFSMAANSFGAGSSRAPIARQKWMNCFALTFELRRAIA